MRKRAKTSAINLITSEKHARAIALRRAGKTYREIAAEIGWADPSVAYTAVVNTLARERAAIMPDVEAVLQIELERMDQCVAGLQAGIDSGDPASVSALVRVSERRSKLLGLDAPSKHEVLSATIPEGSDKSDEDIFRDMAERFRARGVDPVALITTVVECEQ